MKWIEKCLRSVFESTIKVHVVVIDNLSTDNTVAFIQKEFPQVELIRMDRNLGFGQANNVGLRLARERNYDYSFLLNQDAYVYPDMFDLLVKTASAENNDNIGIWSPLHLNGNASKLDSQYKGYISESAPDYMEDMMTEFPKPYYRVKMVPAAGWLLPRKTLDKIGGFDPIFFHYGEDEQYSQRIKYHGMMTAIVPAAKMMHDREGFGNETLARKDDLFNGLKTYIFLNINYTKGKLCKVLSRVLMSYIYESCKCILRGNLKRGIEYPRSIFRNLCNIPTYRRNRKINRGTAANWL